MLEMKKERKEEKQWARKWNTRAGPNLEAESQSEIVDNITHDDNNDVDWTGQH